MKILIVATQPFPSGMAATNRILSYSKGLVELGNDVFVHIVRPTEKIEKIINKLISGDYHGIKYIYTSKTLIWPKYKLAKILVYIKGIVNSIFLIKRSKKGYYSILLTTSNNIYTNIVYKIVSNYYKIIFVKTEDEFPIMMINNKKRYNKVLSNIYLKAHFKLFDAMILMTHTLEKFYKPLMRKSAKTIIVPMTVDPNRFQNQDYYKENKPYVAYAGYLGGNKDGIQNLLKSFKIFSTEYPQYKLYLIGFTNVIEEEKTLKEMITELELNRKVVMTGKVARDDIPKYLCNASMLVLSRPANKQAEGGFPTKVGEYLATGRPVVVTAVGEIPNYLIDGVNAFIAKPDNIHHFADKMVYVAAHYDHALKVAAEGRKLCDTIFNYLEQARKMESFFLSLTNNK